MTLRYALSLLAPAAGLLVIDAAILPVRAAEPAPASQANARSRADQRVLDLLDEDYRAQLEADPVEASRRGSREFDRLLPDLTPEARAKRAAADARRLEAISSAIKEGGLSPECALHAALLEDALKLRIEGERFKLWQIPVTQQNGPLQSLPQIPDNLSFTTRQQVEDYLARLHAVPRYLAQMIECMRAGLEEGRSPARVVMGDAAEQALAQCDERFFVDPASHPMYRPFASGPADLAERGREAIRISVLPAFRVFGEFLRDSYIPGCRESLGASELPDGAAFYAYMIRAHTTLPLAAEAVHQTGLAEVARIRSEMMDVMARSDFAMKDALKGDALFMAFTDYLRKDPRFYCTSAEELLAGYQVIAKRIDAELPRLFGRLPRLSYGVREMPRFIAASAPTAYYYPGSLENGVPGWFIANTWRLDQRPRYEMIALTLHEACPGHHLQYSLASELRHDGWPAWRAMAEYTAYGEGWGLYSERLGLEMGDHPAIGLYGSGSPGGGRGFYEDPYDDFGRLSYEMWRAMRLVVDTGIHAKGWTRDQAINYMLENSALSRTNIEREVDRYIAWPGQALAYKIGELKIRELRAKAERLLGDRFDVRAFHDTLLGQGPVPLSVLEAIVERWIGSRRASGG